MRRKYYSKFFSMALAAVVASTTVMPVLPAYAASQNTIKKEQVTFPQYYTPDLLIPEHDDAIVNAKVEALLKAMTRDEKISFLHGDGWLGDLGNAADLDGVGRLGVPQLKMHDGPAGLYYMTDSTNPPIEQLLAATWDESVAEYYGTLISMEAKAIGAGMMLSPQLDVQRDPQWRRTKDQLGEDPYLLSELGDDLVNGMQSLGGIAVLKHLVSYTEGGHNNDIMSEQTLHELYLAPFEKSVKDAEALGVMSSYNQINGVFASENSYLLNDVLHDLWGYKYFTITDWGGNHSFCLDDGTDIEQYVWKYNKDEVAEELIAAGEFTREEYEDMINTATGRILKAYGKAGYLTLVQLDENGEVMEEVGRTTPIYQPPTEDSIKELAKLYDQANEMVENIANQGAVLLKNEANTLPIDKKSSVAVIGLTGASLAAGTGGERSYGAISAMTSPADALKDIMGSDKVKVVSYNDILGTTIPKENLYVDKTGDAHGVTRTYGVSKSAGASSELQGNALFDAAVTDTAMEGHEIGEFCSIDDEINYTTGLVDGKPNKTYYCANADKGTANAFPLETKPAYAFTSYVEAPEDGEYTLSLQSIGGTSQLVMYAEDGNSILANVRASSSARQSAQWYSSIVPSATGMDVQTATVTLKKGARYKVFIQEKYVEASKDMQLNLSWITPSQKKANIDNSLAAAKTCDDVVIFAYQPVTSVSTIADHSEAQKKALTLELPADQVEMIKAVSEEAHRAGKKVTVVLNNATAVVMHDWINDVDAILEMYLPGQRGGVSTAKLLTGEVNPSGKLAFTIPKSDNDTVITYSDEAWESFQVKNPETGMVDTTYLEGINTGYRFFDEHNIEPEFDFGHGLSYTTFEYGPMSVETSIAEGERAGYDVTFTVKNTGDVVGSETAQVYISQATGLPKGIQSAKYQLVGFKKVKDLAPGEEREVKIHVSERCLSYWNSNLEGFTGRDGKWTVAECPRTLYVAAAADDFKSGVTVDVKAYSEKEITDMVIAKAEAAKQEAMEAAKEAQKALEAAKAEAEKALGAKAETEKALEAAKAELEAAKKEIEAAKQEIEAAKESCKKECAAELEAAKKALEEAQKAYNEAKDALNQKTEVTYTLKVNKKKIVVKKGKTAKIKASVTPSKKITFTSKNKKIAKVTSKGLVKGLKKGKTSIVVKAGNAKKVVKVTVK